MKTKTLQNLFIDSLQDMYYAEKQLIKALPKMAEAATHQELTAAFEDHLAETEGHARKLEQIFRAFGEQPKTKKCPAILGIIDEAEELTSENEGSATINAALIFAAQKAEHYEIASYGGLRDWANLLGNDEVANVFQQILDEEKAADAKLSELAEARCNESAANGITEEASTR